MVNLVHRTELKYKDTNNVNHSLVKRHTTDSIVEKSKIIQQETKAGIFLNMTDLNGTKEVIRDAFVEFREFPCPFKDCNHTKEGECEVKRAVLENNILESRYLNYLNFIGVDIDETSYYSVDDFVDGNENRWTKFVSPENDYIGKTGIEY